MRGDWMSEAMEYRDLDIAVQRRIEHGVDGMMYVRCTPCASRFQKPVDSFTPCPRCGGAELVIDQQWLAWFQRTHNSVEGRAACALDRRDERNISHALGYPFRY